MNSAEMIQRNVVNELAWDPKVDSSNIKVTAAYGVVTLAGYVSSYSEKIAARQAAERVRGVEAVVMHLDVNLLEPARRGDEAIAEAARTALKWNIIIPPHVQVAVQDGILTLRGDVHWNFQRKEAERTVRNLWGVRGVSNAIIVKQPVNAALVADNIEAAFKRNAQIDASHIQIETDGSVVTLKGSVSSWAERRAAESAAWAAPGVAQVRNELNISVPSYAH